MQSIPRQRRVGDARYNFLKTSRLSQRYFSAWKQAGCFYQVGADCATYAIGGRDACGTTTILGVRRYNSSNVKLSTSKFVVCASSAKASWYWGSVRNAMPQVAESCRGMGISFPGMWAFWANCSICRAAVVEPNAMTSQVWGKERPPFNITLGLSYNTTIKKTTTAGRRRLCDGCGIKRGGKNRPIEW